MHPRNGGRAEGSHGFHFALLFLRGTDKELQSLLLRAVEEVQRRPRGLKALFDSGAG